MLTIVVTVYIFKDSISNFITDNVIYLGSNKVLTYNEYYLDYNYYYVQNTEEKKVSNYQDVLNMFYTFLNSGDNSYSFYCDYDNCISDVTNLANEENVVADINNFVHPFNSFATVNIDVTNSGKVTIKSKKVYNDEEIIFIKAYIDEFINNNISEEMTNYDKIKSFHDHIINNTMYDSENKDNSNIAFNAYNLLTTGKSICGGYTDIMSIYLNILGIQNYKVTSENHIWNLVYLDGKWYHMDTTWDDPVVKDGKQYLIHNFFLITTSELHNLDKVEHNFNPEIYVEAK